MESEVGEEITDMGETRIMTEEECRVFLERLRNRGEERKPTIECEDCRTSLEEGEVYGDSAYLCENCCADREDEGEST